MAGEKVEILKEKESTSSSSAPTSNRHPIASTRLEVDKFNGSNNFGMWQCEVMDVLYQQELDMVLEDKPEDIDDKQWTRINLHACATIRSFLDKELKYPYMKETSAKKPESNSSLPLSLDLNEVDKYLTDPFESPLSKQFNLLNWWKGNQTRYPILSQVAKDIFAIPSSTVASENAFSLGKRIVDPFRSSLHPKMVEALVCTSDWLRADEFSFYKEPTDDEVEFYKEMEDMTTYSIGAQTTQRGSSNPLTTNT
ncbi:uncharacterized protein LOC117618305 [Prunus dulcis]|uniref:uncharacterized protein LOC117618305 n=1 Tax=Prunus dulcis TaxID=3755 RepID=UPI001482EF75|nr:uncharacterized protein LOC117618305 [Prunus dulcis]